MFFLTPNPLFNQACRAKLAPGGQPAGSSHWPDGISSASSGDMVMFSGRYSPQNKDLSAMITALRGWPGRPERYAPSYIPSGEIENALFGLLNGGDTDTNGILRQISQRKTRAINFHALLVNQPLRSLATSENEACDFLAALVHEVARMKSDFQRRFQFTDADMAVLNRFIAITAPILFEMGFPDAVRHAAQVSRSCVIRAARQKATKPELLQAAMVGWLHDPKLAGELSLENLATHPVIGSAIAKAIFDEPNVQNHLTVALNGSGMSNADFASGVVEALSINNDSRYVLSEVILKGLAHIVPNLGEIKRTAFHRFTAPHRGITPEPFSETNEQYLAAGRMPTGLRALSLKAFDMTHRKLSKTYPELAALDNRTLLNALLDNTPPGGIPEDQWPDIVAAFSQALSRSKDAAIHVTIQGIHLFSHHQEVKKGQQAALALAISDPLLLSPHKIIEACNDKTCIDGIKEFMRSFGNNVRYIPKEALADAREWQRDLCVGMLKAAHDLTGRNPLADLPPDWTQQRVIQQLNRLIRLVCSPGTWQSQDGTDYGKASLSDPDTRAQAERLVSVMKMRYDEALDASPAMFGTPAPAQAGPG